MSTRQETKVERLARALGDARDGRLRVGSVELGRLAGRISTPCYIYSGDAVVERARRVQWALGRETHLYYSLKANPSLGLCQLMARQDVGAEVASIGELALAQKAGFAPQKTIFAGPGKTDDELELAAASGILSVNVESSGELERLAGIARRLGKPAQAALRVNPTLPVSGSQMRMGGGPQQFGIDEEDLADVVRAFRGRPYLGLVGLHVYAGTQIFDVAGLLEHCRRVVELGRTMSQYLGKPLSVLDFGGGFGVPYFADSPEFDLDGFTQGYRQLVQICQADPGLAPARLIIELGRYLVAEAGVYVTRVVDVKRSRGQTFVVTNGGMNHHIIATGNFGQVFRKPYPIAPIDALEAPTEERVSIVGPCCTPLDTFARDLPFPRVRVGDLIGVFCSGAYGYSASSLAFLSHPTPAEALVWQDQVYVLREPGRADQVLEGQQGLDLECTPASPRD
jgi:diaminopimelate decarboxylase